MKIYLAGPIFGKSDSEATDWRTEATKALLPHECCNPLIWDCRGREQEEYRKIVETDKQAIDGSEVLLAYCPHPSVGTSMEIIYAWERGKTVYIVVPVPHSPWYIYHSQFIFTTLDEAYRILCGRAST